MIDENLLNRVLDARELRVRKRNELIGEYKKPVISVSLNIPGPEKGRECYEPVFTLAWDLLKERLQEEDIKIEYSIKDKTVLGYEGFIVAESDEKKIKLTGLSLEHDHPLGVLFDKDVTDSDGERLSREEFLYPPRLCIVCKKESAFLCIRGKNHTMDETLEAIHNLIGDYFRCDERNVYKIL
jgi:holo-ACP synthase